MLVATEGGPGFPATESRDEYLDLFGPLRDTRDVVLMDNRGTGQSGAINCHPAANSTGRGVGLRGGVFAISQHPDETQLTLYDLRWTEDLSVSGKVTQPRRAGPAAADITVIGPQGNGGMLQLRWTEGVPRARAHVTGKIGNAAVVAETAAP
jgi:hypothetical protein